MGVYKPTILWREISCIHTDLLEASLFSSSFHRVLGENIIYIYTYIYIFGYETHDIYTLMFVNLKFKRSARIPRIFHPHDPCCSLSPVYGFFRVPCVRTRGLVISVFFTPKWRLCNKEKGMRDVNPIYLVGGLEHVFPIYWECHHPNWRTPSFFRGVGQPPTRYSWNTGDMDGFLASTLR